MVSLSTDIWGAEWRCNRLIQTVWLGGRGSISLQRLHNSICEESASRERPNSIFRQVFALVTTNPPFLPLPPVTSTTPICLRKFKKISEHSFIELTQLLGHVKQRLPYFGLCNPDKSCKNYWIHTGNIKGMSHLIFNYLIILNINIIIQKPLPFC
jgi:hypothetical protein